MNAQLKQRINQLKVENPTAAKAYADYFFKRNEINDLVEGKFGEGIDIDEIVKEYPGSPKGPLPADDPEFYSQWFMRN